MFIINLLLRAPAASWRQARPSSFFCADAVAPILTQAGFHSLHVGFVFVFNLVVGMISPLGHLFLCRQLYRPHLHSGPDESHLAIHCALGLGFIFFVHFPQIAMIVPKIFKIRV